ncbi:MAG: hypothetical protein AAGC81_01900 [Pseudomonadota bacterium]
MSEAEFQAVERHAWQGEGGVRKLFIPKERNINRETREIDFIVSTAAKDRDGDVVEPGGWVLDQYRENPVVLFAHDSGKPPIARASNITIEDGALRATAKFADAETYAFADTVFRLYEGGFLNAVSAGFMPMEMEPLPMIEGERNGFRFTRQTLWEFSAVPIPSNPEALVEAKGAGIDVDPCIEHIEEALDTGRFSEAEELLAKTYVQLKGKMHPVAQDRLAQKNLEKLREKASANEVIEHPITVTKGDLVSNRYDLSEVIADLSFKNRITLSGYNAPASEDKEPNREVIKDRGDTITSGPGGEDNHTHDVVVGDDQTAEAGDPLHAHGVVTNDDGTITVMDEQGHGHDAPEAPVVNAEEELEASEEQLDQERAEAEEALALARSTFCIAERTLDLARGELEAAQKRLDKVVTPEPEPTPQPQAPDPELYREAISLAVKDTVPSVVSEALRLARGQNS